MGTSTSHKAPSRGSWPRAKGLVSTFAREGGGGSVLPADVLSAFVDAVGGVKGATANAKVGQAIAGGFADFVSDVANRGLDQALDSRGLGDLSGRPTRDVMVGIVDYLAGPGDTIPEATARKVMLEVISEMWKEIDPEVLKQAKELGTTNELITEFLERFIATHVKSMIEADLGAEIEKGAMEPAKIRRVEKALKKQIRKSVKLAMKANDPRKVSWGRGHGARIVKSLYQNTFKEMKRLL